MKGDRGYGENANITGEPLIKTPDAAKQGRKVTAEAVGVAIKAFSTGLLTVKREKRLYFRYAKAFLPVLPQPFSN